MSVPLRKKYVAAFLLPFFLSLLVVAYVGEKYVHAQATISGTHTATEADLTWMRYAGFRDPKVGQAVNINDPNIGKEAGEVKQWLAQHATKDVNVSCFEAEFAKKLKRFMEAVPGGIPVISSGYRPPQAQTALVASGASKAGPCQSYHNYGLAADFNGKANTPWMRANSRNFGINTIGAWDPGHFQDNRGRFGQCGACSGGAYGTQANAGPSSHGPSGLSDTFRQTTGLGQPPPPPPEQPRLPSQQQPLSTSQRPTQYFPTQDTKQATGSPLLDGKKAEDYPFGNVYQSNLYDKLYEIAYGTTSTSTSGSTATGTVYVGGTAVGLEGQPATSTPATTTVPITGIHPSQTFVSPDLSFSPPVTPPVTGFQATLESLRQILLQTLAILRPFGLREYIESQTNPEYYME